MNALNNMMQNITVKEYFALPAPQQYNMPNVVDPELFGIEVELENCPSDAGEVPKPIANSPWQYVYDGSLRNNGIEFVSQPVSLEQALDAVDSLESYLKQQKLKWEANARTGVHIHVNVQQLNRSQFLKFILLSSMFEPYLYALGGYRQDNPFCVPLMGSLAWQGYLHSVRGSVGQKAWNVQPYWTKYLGINLMSLKTYGTVEFRHFETPKDLQQIKLYLKFLHQLYVTAVHSEHEWDYFIDFYCKITEDRDKFNTLLKAWLPEGAQHDPWLTSDIHRNITYIKSVFFN